MLDQTDVLQYALSSGILDMSYLQEQADMARRQEALKNHNHSIWFGKDGNWWTHIEKDGKLKKVKRKRREDLEQVIAEQYSSRNQKTFFDFYWHWRSVQDQTVSNSTIVKYETDYKRFFKGEDFERIDMRKLNEEVIKLFIINSAKDKHLRKGAVKSLYGYIHNTILSAQINQYINDDPMRFLAAKNFYKYCETPTAKASRLVSDDEMDKFYQNLYEGYEQHPEYIPAYAVELAILTGMRVGELAALRWDAITNDYIVIDKSEKYDRLNKTYYIDTTKNGKERNFPMTHDIMKLLDRIRKVEMEHGYFCEWVFANENGRVHANVISSCVKNRCRVIGIPERGIHAFRRTLNSKLRCNGVSVTVAASLLGHTEDVNEKYYTFDVTSLKERASFVESVQKSSRASVS